MAALKATTRTLIRGLRNRSQDLRKAPKKSLGRRKLADEHRYNKLSMGSGGFRRWLKSSG